ncbi:uncharacterized protein LOC128405128 [Podarcis raffonei]|uniref:uncharacterized protein LOC128405128 n=1 Tax=Podarcis raffonei TaxID=65483 RepID=UPI00232943B3|nr:uncharacterized protein LOC128405128 [Podarcis raffonei]XP_053227341.1 uncharacterized protein LOC128405128 [Podarcis raffonei]
MVAPPPGLFSTRAPASGKKQQHRTLRPETQILDVSHAAPVLPMSCSEEDLSSSSSLVSNPRTSPAAKSVSTFPMQSDSSKSSSLSDDAISLKTASSLKSGRLGPSKAQLQKSSSQLPLPPSRSTSCCILSRFPEDCPPRPRTPLCAMREAGCSTPPGSLKAPSSLPAPRPLCLGVEERQPREKEENFEQQLSHMEARLKAVQEQQTLWLQELVPAVRRVRSELANIGQSLARLVQMFEAQVPACPHFHATQEKGAAKAEGSRAGGKHLFHPTFTHRPCQEI